MQTNRYTFYKQIDITMNIKNNVKCEVIAAIKVFISFVYGGCIMDRIIKKLAKAEIKVRLHLWKTINLDCAKSRIIGYNIDSYAFFCVKSTRKRCLSQK